MAYRLVFHYFPGRSNLHRWDARCKFPALLALSFATLHMDMPKLVILTGLLGAALISIRLPLRSFLQDVKSWGLFLLFILLLQVLFPSGPDPTPPGPPFFHAIQPAILTCWRLGLLLCYAALFTSVTRSRELQEALIWFMNPLPFFPGRRIALMVALTMRFLPLLLDQWEEVRTAIRSRMGERRKNPIVRAKCASLPLFRRSLIRADELALALAARGYREDLPLRIPPVPPKHVLLLMLWFAFLLILSALQAPEL